MQLTGFKADQFLLTCFKTDQFMLTSFQTGQLTVDPLQRKKKDFTCTKGLSTTCVVAWKKLIEITMREARGLVTVLVSYNKGC